MENTTKTSKGMNRRTFLGVTVSGAAATTMITSPIASRAAPASGTSGTATAVADDRERFRYFGPNKNVQAGYFKFLNTPVTVMDFGLTPAQAEHAAELHKTLHIFDSEPEVGYYDGYLDDLHRSGCASPCGSYTMDAFPHDLVNGLEKDFRIRPADWWSRATLESNLSFMSEMLKHKGDQMMICTKYADLMEAKKTGKAGFMLDTQNTQFIANDLSQVDYFYEKGIRRVQLSYNQQMAAATGCMEPRDGGVTMWGAQVIGKLNDAGVLVDTGHCSSMTLLDAIDISEKPIYCSHAGLRAIAPKNPRTHTDEGLKKLADNGGVFGCVGVPGTLVSGSSEATVADFVNAIDHAINNMGIDHVGFALDQAKAPSPAEFFTSPDWPPEAVAAVSVTDWPWSDLFLGMENQGGYINLTRGLVAKGYKDADIRKIMGENHMRLIKEVVG